MYQGDKLVINGNIDVGDISTDSFKVGGKTVETIIKDETKYDISLSRVDVSGDRLVVNGNMSADDILTDSFKVGGRTVETIIRDETKYDISLSKIDVSGDNLNINGNVCFSNLLKSYDISTNTFKVGGRTVETIIKDETKYDISLSSIDVSGDNLNINGNICEMIL